MPINMASDRFRESMQDTYMKNIEGSWKMGPLRQREWDQTDQMVGKVSYYLRLGLVRGFLIQWPIAPESKLEYLQQQ